MIYRGAWEDRAQRWFSHAPTRPSRLLRLGIMLAPLAVAVVLAVPICPSALLAGVPCPGCGLTRAALALSQGDLAGATALNPLAIVVVPLLGGAAAHAAWRYVWRGRVEPNRWHADKILIASMIALTAVWLARWAGYFGGPVSV